MPCPESFTRIRIYDDSTTPSPPSVGTLGRLRSAPSTGTSGVSYTRGGAAVVVVEEVGCEAKDPLLRLNSDVLPLLDRGEGTALRVDDDKGSAVV